MPRVAARSDPRRAFERRHRRDIGDAVEALGAEMALEGDRHGLGPATEFRFFVNAVAVLPELLLEVADAPLPGRRA